MKKGIVGLTFLFSMMALLSAGCSFAPKASVTGKTIIAAIKKDNSGKPVISLDTNGGSAFEVGDRKYTVWGVEDDQWQTLGSNRGSFLKYIEGSNYTNANCIAVHCPWKLTEPEKDVYNFDDLDFYLDQCRKNNFKVIIYWTSTDYAVGDNTFTPDYILQDKATYSRIVLDDYPNVTPDKASLCPADPDTLAREQKAVKKLFEHIKEVNNDGIILAVNIGSEVDFIHSLGNISNINLDIRCNCDNCKQKYKAGQDNLEYTKEIFANYTKNIIDAADSVYEMPIYTPVASLIYWSGGRFVEQPDYIKKVVNLKNHFVCPSIAPTTNSDIFIKEMDQFVKIKGNYPFASGIGTGSAYIPFNNQPHLEIAPWLNIFHYNGLGAIYWDDPNMTITKTKGTREKLRTGWGPLKAGEYYISSLKGEKAVT
jgi:hypothetical protein